MSEFISLLALLGISLLLGKLLFDGNSSAAKKATEPTMRNFIWQTALAVSSLALLSRYIDIDQWSGSLLSNQLGWILVSLGILAFSLIAMIRLVQRLPANP